MTGYIDFPRLRELSSAIISMKVTGRPSIRFESKMQGDKELTPVRLDSDIKFVFLTEVNSEIRSRALTSQVRLEKRKIYPIHYKSGGLGTRVQSFYKEPVKRITLKSECFRKPDFRPLSFASEGFEINKQGAIGCIGCNYVVKEERWGAYTSVKPIVASESGITLSHEHKKYLKWSKVDCPLQAKHLVEHLFQEFRFREFVTGVSENNERVTILTEYESLLASRHKEYSEYCTVITDPDKITCDDREVLFLISYVYESIGTLIETLKEKMLSIRGDVSICHFYSWIAEKLNIIRAIEPCLKDIFFTGKMVERKIAESRSDGDGSEDGIDRCKDDLEKAFQRLLDTLNQFGDEGMALLMSTFVDKSKGGAKSGYEKPMSDTVHDILLEVNKFVAALAKEFYGYAGLLKSSKIFPEILHRVFMQPSEKELAEQMQKMKAGQWAAA